jgi:hypothetical protein
MAALALGAIGAAIGSYVAPEVVAFGLTGSAIGWAVGSVAGQLLAPGQHAEGPRIGDRSISASTLGTPMTVLYGTGRLAGNVIDCSNPLREVSNTSSVGKGGGSTVTNYSYNCDIAIDLCAGPVAGIRKIWRDGKLVYDVSTGASAASIIASSFHAKSFTFYPGDEAQLPDPTLEALHGVGNVPAYRGRAYVVFAQLECPGGRIPQLNFEVVSQATATQPSTIYATVSAPSYASSFPTHASIGELQTLQVDGNTTLVRGDHPMYRVGQGYSTYLGAPSIAGSGQASDDALVPVQSSRKPRALHVWSTTAVGATVHKTIDVFLADGTYGGTIFDGDTPNAGAGYHISWAAYDEISGMYAVVGTDISASPGNGKVITFLPGGNATGVLADSRQPVAFYDSVAYIVGEHGGTTWLDKYGSDGSTLTGIDSGQSITVDALLVCANAHGVYVLESLGDITVDRRLWKVTDDGWTLLTSTARFDNSNVTTKTFFCNDQFAIVGPSVASGGTVDYRLIAFSALAPSEASVADILLAECERAGLTSGQVDVSGIADTVHGYPVTRAGGGRATIEPLLKAFFIDPVEADGKVNFIKRANQAQAASIAFDDLAAVEGGGSAGDPFPLQRMQESDLPRSITVQYIDINADYQPGAEQGLRQVTSSINDVADDIAICTASDHAKQVADVLLFDAWSARNKRSGKLTREYAYLTPGDVALIEYPRGTFQQRQLTRVNDTGALIEFEAIDANADLYRTTPLGSAGSSSQVLGDLPSPAQLAVLDMPIVRDVDDNAGVYVALAPLREPASGAQLFLGVDDSSLTGRGIVTAPAPIGVTETVLGGFTEGFIDELNLVTVSIGPDTLASTTRDRVLTTTDNLCAIGAAGRWEILQFIRVASLGAGRYTLSGLRRGRYGTQDSRANHTAADTFVLLTQAGMLRPLFDVSALSHNYRFRPVGLGLPLDSADSVVAQNTGVGLMPLAPYNLRGSRAANDLTLTWSRRSRLSNNWLLGLVPLGETSEAYSIDVYASNAYATVKRTLTAATATVTYTSAQQIADFGSNQAVVYVRIYQLSSVIGRGFYLQGAI